MRADWDKVKGYTGASIAALGVIIVAIPMPPNPFGTLTTLTGLAIASSSETGRKKIKNLRDSELHIGKWKVMSGDGIFATVRDVSRMFTKRIDRYVLPTFNSLRKAFFDAIGTSSSTLSSDRALVRLFRNLETEKTRQTRINNARERREKIMANNEVPAARETKANHPKGEPIPIAA